jgi:adenylosuccinate lyase
MIDRYSLPEMEALWTDDAKIARWLEVELLATEAHVALGVVPAADAAACRAKARMSAAEVLEREKVTDHDVAAFVDLVQASIGFPAGGWIHYGLTSTDVVDTALCLALVQSIDLLLLGVNALGSSLQKRALEFVDTPCMGRTHGIHAEPTTFGMKLALWTLTIDRDRTRLLRAREALAVGKLSGAVGTFSNIDPSVETYVCERLGLTPVPATQVIARDRHAEFLSACASIGTTIETISIEIRHLQRTEVREVREPFRAGQKGSSAMPHKRNPITVERLSGLARILRGNLVAGLENVALWHERDISHSSVERVILPDTCLLTHYMLTKMRSVIDGLHVDSKRMLTNIDASFGLVFSQSILLALVAKGMGRDDAYRVVQELALQAWDEERSFRTLVESDARIALAASEIDEAFDLTRVLRHANRSVDAAQKITF